MTENWKAPDDAALVIVDVQNDFCPGGALAVPGGDEIVPVINELRTHFNTIVITQDWHPAGHKSFASAHPGKAPFDAIETDYGTQVLWPDHCVQGTEGADFHPDLIVAPADLIIRKGTNPEIDSYSAFYENDKKTAPLLDDGQTLSAVLRKKGILKPVFAGLALDYCVGWNADDARAEGFEPALVFTASRSITPEGEQAMIEKLEAQDIPVIGGEDLPSVLGLSKGP